MKRIVFPLVFCCCLVSAQAQNDHTETKLTSPRPKVGVVFGGGGAKGASHIGVLKYIEEMGIPVDYVSGTSMGAIIGGLYALGYSPDELTHLISNMDWRTYIGNKIDRNMMSEESRKRSSTTLLNIPFGLDKLFDKDPSSTFIDQLPSAYVNNSSLVNLFNDLCIGYQEEMDFNDMPIPFACVATDMVTGDEVVLRSGILPNAMRASMAIPGVFAPVTMGSKILVDGGLVNNFPADVLREMGADIIIGIEVTKEKKIQPEELGSLPKLLARLVTNSTSAKRKENRELCNIRIVPDISGFGMLSFTPEAIDTLVERGYKMASRHHDRLKAIKVALDSMSPEPVKKVLHAPKAKNLATDSIMLNSIEITGITDQQSRWLIRKDRLKPGTKVVENDIESTISLYRGTGCFDEIIYNIKETDSLHLADTSRLSEAYNLTIDMKPAYPHIVGVGVRYDTEEGAALLLNIGLNEKKFGGPKLYLSGKLSYNPRFNVTYTYSRPSLGNFNVAYDYRDEHFGLIKTIAERGQTVNLHFLQHKMSGYISQFHLLYISTTVGASYTTSRFDKTSLDSEFYDTLYFKPNRLITPFVTFKYDDLDNTYFATQGIYASLSNQLYIDPGSHAPSPFDISFAFKSYFTPSNGRFSIIPKMYGRLVFNNGPYYNTWNHIGGEIEGRHFENQLPFIGFNQLQTASDFSTVLRCDLRYNFIGKHYITAIYNTLLQLNVHEHNLLDAYHGVGLKYAYNSILGPISLTGQWSNSTKAFSGYFSIGYTF